MTGKGDGTVGYGVLAGVAAIVLFGLASAPDQKNTPRTISNSSDYPAEVPDIAPVDDAPENQSSASPDFFPAQVTDEAEQKSVRADGLHAVRLLSAGGVLSVPVSINGLVDANFTVDSGASVVVISEELFISLLKRGGVSKNDYIGTEQYTLADGSVVESPVFTIRKLAVGDVTMRDIKAAVTKTGGGLLLGQSFLKRFKKWHIDNDRQELIFEI